jgi:hypothetical protein
MPAANTWSTCCTSTMAAEKSFGRPLSKTSSAAGPPAEEPMATSRLAEAELRAGLGAGRSRARLSPISQPMLRILRSSGAAASWALPAPRAGVSTTSSAPWPMASNTRCTFCWRSTVTMTMAQGSRP